MDHILSQVKDFADKAHGEQTRKYTPDRYIVHPMRVMEICRQYTNDLTILSAAILHDVLEDTPVQKHELEEFLQTIMDRNQVQRTVKLVVELTDIYVKENYPQWNRRKRKAKEFERMEKTSGEAQTIKYADIVDNCTEIVSLDHDFAHIFLHECRQLLAMINKGNAQLYQRAIETVQKELDKLNEL